MNVRGVYVCISVYFQLCMSCKLKALYFMICISYIVKPKTFFMSVFSGHWISLHNVFNAPLLFYYMIHQHLFNHHVAIIENLILFLFFGCISDVARKSLICKLLLLSVPIVTWSEKLLIRWLHLLRLFKKMWYVWPLNKVVPIYVPAVLWKHFCFPPAFDNIGSYLFFVFDGLIEKNRVL